MRKTEPWDCGYEVGGPRGDAVRSAGLMYMLRCCLGCVHVCGTLAPSGAGLEESD